MFGTRERLDDIGLSGGESDESWAAAVVDALAPLLHGNLGICFEIVEHQPDFTSIRRRVDILPVADRETIIAARDAIAETLPLRQFFTPPRLVVTHSELHVLSGANAEAIDSWRRRGGAADAIRLFAYPEPGVVMVLSGLHDRPIALSSRQRRLLLHVVLQLETSYRLRRVPAALIGILHDDARWSGAVDPSTVWSNLVEGRWTLLPRRSPFGRDHLLVETAVAARPFRALTLQELDVVGLALRGVPTKAISYELDVTPSAVSKRLEAAAQKVGVGSRSDLVRLGGALMHATASSSERSAAAGTLTSTEDDVLQLVRQGLTNDEIAAMRTRSVRTIANQVASILRKTKTASRRGLMASASDANVRQSAQERNRPGVVISCLRPEGPFQSDRRDYSASLPGTNLTRQRESP